MTKKDHIKTCQSIRDRYKDGEFIEGVDIGVMIYYLKKHRWYKQKIGDGEYAIYVDTDPRYKTRGFYICRGNGTTTDFSYYNCVYPGKGYQADFRAAARSAVSTDIIEWRDKYFYHLSKTICTICGKLITKHDCHVDHHPLKFREILKEFIDHYNIKGDDFHKFTEPENWDNISGVEITDSYIKYKWIEYHHMNAEYRMLCPGCNLKEG